MPVAAFGRDGFARGARDVLPLAASGTAFGVAFGVAAAEAGLTLTEAVVMSGLVFGGTSQMVALQLWAAPVPVLAIVLSTLAVNARLVLMSAAMRPWLHALGPRIAYPSLFFMTDGNWLLAMRERSAGRHDAAHLVGSGILLYAAWVASTAAGHGLGAWIGDPRALALDFVLLAFCAIMLAAVRRGRADLLPWTVAAVAAVVADAWVPGSWHVLIGGLAGSIAGAVRSAHAR